jgi:hypothetical protein
MREQFRQLGDKLVGPDPFFQSGSFAGAIALGGLAPCGNGGPSLVAPLSGFIPDGAGTAIGLLSPPLGETFTPASSRTEGGLATEGFGPLGVATRRPLITARTSLIARVCSRGDLSMLIWSMLGSLLTSTLASEP